MKSALKILAGLTVMLILLLVTAGFLLPIIYDEEDLKAAISREVRQQTGRELSINGDLDFSVFPWVAVEVSDLILGNAAGFGDQPQAKIGRARAGVALIPLFQKQVSVDEITLEGLELFLMVDENGHRNWDDLSGLGNPAEVEGDSLFSSKRVAGLNIRDASIDYRDRTVGAHYRLAGFSIQAGALAEDRPLPLELATLLEDVAAGTRASLQLNTIATINIDANHYLFDDMDLTIELESEGITGHALRVLAPRLYLDLNAETLKLETFALEVAGLQAAGSVSADNILQDASFMGSLTVADFSPQKLMQALQLEAPDTADAGVLRHAALRTDFSGGTTQLQLTDVSLELDQSRLSGNLQVQNFDHPTVGFTLAMDGIDIDRYLEPAAEGGSAAGNDVVLPQEQLQGHDLNGQITVGTLNMAGMTFNDARLGISIKNGKLRLNPLAAGFYGGQYNGDVTLDGSGAVPVISLDEKIESISFQQLVEDLVDSDSLSGTAGGQVRLTGRGKNSSEVLSKLQGNVGLALTDGAVEGINIWYQIRRGMAIYQGLPAPDPEPRRTVFSRLVFSGTVQDGVVSTRDLVGELPFLTLRGSGKIDLGQSQLNLGLVAEVRNSPELAEDPLGSDLGGKSLPFKITGPLDDPSLSMDWEALLKSEAGNILLNKLGLGPKEEAAEKPEDGENTESVENPESEPEKKSSRDQMKEAARGALFELLKGKDKDEDADEKEEGN